MNLSISENMELLETALKQSFSWSLDKKRAVTGESTGDNHSSKTAQSRASKEVANSSVDFVQLDSQNEAQVRAFVTRFKIELNQLMGLKSVALSSIKADEDDSLISDDTYGTVDFASHSTDERRKSGKKFVEPTIQLNGKYSGVYNLSGPNSDDDEEEEEDDDEYDDDDDDSILTEEAYARHMQLVYGVPKDSFTSTNLRLDPQIDDGYRSLSRDSMASKGTRKSATSTTGATKPRSVVELLKQLNDIKSRVIDLVQELDQVVGPKLSEDQLQAYQRRRDALVNKLEALIENHKPTTTSSANGYSSWSSSTSTTTSDNRKSAPVGAIKPRESQIKTHHLTTSGESSSTSDSYEEQVQVIDYDFDRRASDLSEIRRYNCFRPGKPIVLAAGSNSNKELALNSLNCSENK